MSGAENRAETLRRIRGALEISKIDSALAALKAFRDEVFLMPKPSKLNIEAAAQKAITEIDAEDQQIQALSGTDVTPN